VLINLTTGDYRSAAGWGAQIPIVWLTIYGAYLGVMYRTSSDFRRLAYNNVIATIIGFSALTFVKVFGYWGLIARSIITSGVGLFLGRRYVPVNEKAELDAKGLVALAKISLPLSVPGYIGTSCLSATLSYLILQYRGQSGLGIYGVALTFQAMVLTIATAAHQMLVTKITQKLGETGDITTCLKYAKLPTLLNVAVASALALALYVVIGPIIRLTLPSYEEAIPIIRILAWKLPIFAAALPLIILNSALWYKSVIILALIPFFVSLTVVAFFPKTLDVIATSMILGDFCALVVGYIILRFNK
jgi:hypothetical protein